MVKNRKTRRAVSLILAAALLLTGISFLFPGEAVFGAARPSKVKNLKITRVKQNSVQLSWKKIKKARGYQIYRSQTKKGPYKRVKTIKKRGTRTYTNKKLKANTTYFYKVRAYRLSEGKKLYGSFSSIKRIRTMKKMVSQNRKNEEKAKRMEIVIAGKTFRAELYDTAAAEALMKRLPLTLNMKELNGNEKYYYMNQSLPTDSKSIRTIRTGDIMLYGSDCLVLFYEDFVTSYRYTRIGRIENTRGLAEALGKGSVNVTFRAAP